MFACVNILSSPLRFIGDVVARFALVLAERSHFEACLVAAFGLQHGVGHGRRGRAAELAQSLGEGPKTVFKAGEGVVGTLGRDGKRQIRVDGQIGRVEEANVLRFYIESELKVEPGCPAQRLRSISEANTKMFVSKSVIFLLLGGTPQMKPLG